MQENTPRGSPAEDAGLARMGVHDVGLKVGNESFKLAVGKKIFAGGEFAAEVGDGMDADGGDGGIPAGRGVVTGGGIIITGGRAFQPAAWLWSCCFRGLLVWWLKRAGKPAPLVGMFTFLMLVIERLDAGEEGAFGAVNGTEGEVDFMAETGLAFAAEDGVLLAAAEDEPG